jgi:hypothetical protein
MTTTKTALTPEQSAIEIATSTQLAHAAATELQTRRHADRNAAETVLANIEAEWAAGIDKATAMEFAVANAELLRTTSLCEVADTAAIRTKAARTSVDTSLAELVKPGIETALPGIPVSVGFLRPMGKPDNLPAAYVLQSSLPTIVDGHPTGSVQIHYFRSKLYGELDSVAVQDAADFFAEGMRVSICAPYSRAEDGYLVDIAEATIQYDAPHAKVTSAAPTEAMANRAASNLACELAAATMDTARGEGPIRMLKGGKFASNALTAVPDHGRVSGSGVDENGDRYSTVEVRISYWQIGSGRRLPEPMDTYLNTVLEGCIGAHANGLGICQSAKRTSIDFPGDGTIHCAIVLEYLDGAQ